MNLPEASATVITIPTFQIASGSLILAALVVTIVIVIYCQVRYPRMLESAFHVPDGINGITATELILFRIFVMISFISVLKEILAMKLS